MKKQIIQLLISLRFAIFLLILIAILCGLGSILEQDQTIEYYKEYYPLTNSFINYKLILFFGLDHTYKSWFFLLLLTFLGLSLITCTFQQQLPLLQLARQSLFFTKREQFFKLLIKSFIPNDFKVFEKCIRYLQSVHFYLHQQKYTYYASKGLFGKIGPIIVHFSLVCIFLGSLYGALGKFTAQEFVAKGEITRIQNILGSGFSANLPHYAIRINDFWINYDKQKIKQFYSDISVLNTYGDELTHKTISVNDPLFYKNVVFYQTDWGILGLRIQNEQKQIFQYPLLLINKNPKVWSSFISKSNDGRIIIIDQLRQLVDLYDLSGNRIFSISFGENFDINNFNYSILDILPETGLQVKYDPSIPLTFTGFGILMLSTLLSYLTFTQIWFFRKESEIFLGGQTNRSKLFFEIEFFKLLKTINR